MQQCVYETKICDIDDLQKCLMQTWFTLNQMLSTLRLSSGATVWDHVCVLVADILNIHAVKLLFICIVWFIRTFYETINVIWCIWRLFRS